MFYYSLPCFKDIVFFSTIYYLRYFLNFFVEICKCSKFLLILLAQKHKSTEYVL